MAPMLSFRFLFCKTCGVIVQSGTEFIYLTGQPEDGECEALHGVPAEGAPDARGRTEKAAKGKP